MPQTGTAFVQFSRISISFGDRDLLTDITLRLAAGTRVCLAGANGSGKSTLMKIIAGITNADHGEISIQKNTRISYLPQSGINNPGIVHHGKTLRQEAEEAFDFIHTLIERMEEIGDLLDNAKSDSSTKNLIEEHHSLQEQIEKSGYYRREADIYSVLTGLGFSKNDIKRDVGEFSSGWQMRIALAKVLLEKPDILLLDEPTNYLDIEARYWLEKWLETFSGGFMLVSHDRYFLDVCVNEVYEIFNGNLTRFTGNYSTYEKTRQIELTSLVKRYEEQQEEIAKTEALIRRFRYKASKAAFAQDLVKRLEKMERIVIPESFKKINISFPPPPHSPNVVLTLEGIGKSYKDLRVLDKLDLCLEKKERLVVAGPNGAGKSTLLRIIAGADANYEGEIKYGAGIKTGYFCQDAAEALNSSESILEYMEKEAPTHLVPKLRDMLGAFLFRGDDVYKSVSVLSGGEKSRLALLKMFLKPMNLLILDEPTNHLDLYSKDILLDALKKFDGTIIFVSHDRAFMEELSTKTLELSAQTAFSPCKAKLFYGNYAYYFDRLSNHYIVNNEQRTINNEPLSENKLQRTENKQKQAALRRLQRQEAEILKELEELEAMKLALETELTLPEVYSNGEKAKDVKRKLDECSENIEAKTLEWEKIVCEIENIFK
ncbi:MAG: ABC-F family ATP-binding cassette domain-containing protein [Treponema sp.]|jgi:ATP-binding cassette subfamily F protein 3|nr:ABC-F family ATP-binding cassette domain-containing protein [Treponema sp.]